MQKSILIHEACHLLLRHPERSKALVKKYGAAAHAVANYVADGKINSALEMDGIQLPQNAVRVEDVCDKFNLDRDFVVKESLEKIVIEIMKNSPAIQRYCQGQGQEQEQGDELQGDIVDGEFEGEVVNEGDKRIAEARDEEELAKAKEEIIREIEVSAKMAGRGTNGLSRIINEMRKPKVNWRRILRVSMERGLGNDVRKTWSRSSKKHPSLPAKTLYGVKKVIALTDTSGSITPEDLKQILGELHAIAKIKAQVTVIPWDWEVYDAIEMKSPRDIDKVMKNLKGGGGTRITPAIEKAKKLYKGNELVVIFSDFHLEEDDRKLNELLKGFKNPLLVSVNGRVPNVKARVVKVETV